MTEQFYAPTIQSVYFSLDEFVPKFLSGHDVAPRTIVAYKKALGRFRVFMQGKDYPSLDTIVEYKKQLEDEGLTPNTISLYLSAVRALFEWLEAHKIYPNVARAIKNPKGADAHLKNPFTKEQALSILKSVDLSTITGLRDFAILNLLFRAGLRLIEVERTDVQDLDRKEGRSILWVQRKGRAMKDKFVVLTKPAEDALLAWLEAYKGDGQDPMFVTLKQSCFKQRLRTHRMRLMFQMHLKRVGISDKKLTAHSTRHFAATSAIENGADIFQVQEFLGHSAPTTTMRYVRNINRIQKAAEDFISL